MPPLDEVLVVDRRTVTPETLLDIASTASTLTGADHPQHVSRYPGFARRLRDVGVESTSVPAVARDLVEVAGRTLVPTPVDRELRLSVMRDIDWVATAPASLAAAAESDPEAFNELGSRLLGMAAWQEIDLGDLGEPICAFGQAQERHHQLLDSLGWTTPERAIPDARRALEDDLQRREFVFGPVPGVVVWEVEELIGMGRAFLEALGRDLMTVGVYIRGASMRRPYAETHDLMRVLAAEGTTLRPYADVDITAEPDPGSIEQGSHIESDQARPLLQQFPLNQASDTSAEGWRR